MTRADAPAPAAGLAPALAEALRALARRPVVLIASDFDGCLAPFVADPEDARPLPAARDALHRLAAAPGTVVALVSGRPLDALRRLADPPAAALLVGSHGAQFAGPRTGPSGASATGSGASGEGDGADGDGALGEDDGAPGEDDGAPGEDDGAPGDGLAPAARDLLRRLVAELTAIVDDHPGATLEVKPTAAVLHTRRADRGSAAAATRAALAGPATWVGVHAMRGKEVVELSVTDATKGAALRRLRAVVGLSEDGGGVLYLGDDVTDERAFAVLDDDAGDVTVKVGDGDTVARHRVADPLEVAALLTELARWRPAGAR